jgi:uncharacterized protein involved in exopolysaccharide biosynthesis
MRDIAIVVAILFGLAAFLFLLAPRLSGGLVRVKARSLPSALAERMEEEWLGELNALISRAGKLAFAIALMMTRRRSFLSGGESMSVTNDRPGNLVAVFGGWKALLLVPALVFGAAGYTASYLLPVTYASEGLLLLRPQGISKDFVRGLSDIPPDQRIEALRQTMMSRSYLTRLIASFDSLNEAAKRTTLDKAVQEQRDSIEIRMSPGDSGVATVRVQYVGYDPSVTKEVAQWLITSMLEAELQTKQDHVASNLAFMQSQLEEIEGRLRQAELDAEASVLSPSEKRSHSRQYALLESAYKSAFEKNEELKTIEAMEAKQKGEYLAVIDAPNEGYQVGPNRWGVAAFGAGAGLAFGGAAIFGLNRRQRRQLA